MLGSIVKARRTVRIDIGLKGVVVGVGGGRQTLSLKGRKPDRITRGCSSYKVKVSVHESISMSLNII